MIPPSIDPIPEHAETSVSQLTAHIFRHESGRIVSILTGLYGAHRLQLAEDVVQESLIRALKTWPYAGIPENPSAWLLRTAKNLALDQLRREQNFLKKQPEILAEILADEAPAEDFESGVRDDQLRMMFICCHPILPSEAQSALALRTLCGFSPAEIASAFLISEVAVSKRLTRARQKIQSERIPFEIPSSEDLPSRLHGVLKIIYLLFNEGHKASYGQEITRAELCMESLRLGNLLVDHPAGNQAETHALLALMNLTAARLPARTDSEGNLLLLENQDRGLWDAKLIKAGIFHLAKSSEGNRVSEYHLQAGIAACHTLAADDASTDWPRILSFYDHLIKIQPTPVVALNRAIAISKVRGPDEAIRAIDDSSQREMLETYHLFHATLGELEWKRGKHPLAAEHFRKAWELAETRPERSYLSTRLETCLGEIQATPSFPPSQCAGDESEQP